MSVGESRHYDWRFAPHWLELYSLDNIRDSPSCLLGDCEMLRPDLRRIRLG